MYLHVIQFLPAWPFGVCAPELLNDDKEPAIVCTDKHQICVNWTTDVELAFSGCCNNLGSGVHNRQTDKLKPKTAEVNMTVLALPKAYVSRSYLAVSLCSLSAAAFFCASSTYRQPEVGKFMSDACRKAGAK